MGMTGTVGNAVGKRRHRRHAVISEINVTPMVDVMLVLLIVFMVSAPLLTVGVPIDLPQTQAKSLGRRRAAGRLAQPNGRRLPAELRHADADRGAGPQAQAMHRRAAAAPEERIYARRPQRPDWGAVMRVMGRLSAAGFRKVALVTEVERGS
jgi:biopolymer transport protein TolR